MSHANLVYPSCSDLNRADHGDWSVRDERDGPTLLDLTDTVIDRLHKAEGLAWVLHDAREGDRDVAETAAVVADLVHEALEAHRAMWGKVRG